MTDHLKKYLSSDRSTRVQAVRLTTEWTSGLQHQDLPEGVRDLLGELVAAATLMAANLKFDGSLVLQLQGNGPVALLVAECTADLNVRATASLRDDYDPATATIADLQTLVNPDGQGRFAVILDPRKRDAGMQPYQGIVPLEGESVAAVLEHYMHTSEQLDTRLWLAADGHCCAGLLLQRLPEHGGTALEDTAQPATTGWEDFNALISTVTHDELLTLSIDALIHRLLWQETLIALPPQTIRWHCPCSRERVAHMLSMLGREEVMTLLQEQDRIDVACNFCGKPYEFDVVDCASLFSSTMGPGATPGATIH